MMTLVVGREAVDRNRSSARHHGSLQCFIHVYIIIIQLLTSGNSIKQQFERFGRKHVSVGHYNNRNDSPTPFSY
jgi:hypothetical protein